MLTLSTQEKVSTLQLKLPLDLGVKINPNDPVVTFKEVIEGVNLKKFLDLSKKDNRGREGYDPEVLLKIVLFAYMNSVRSTRKIAALCRNDIRFMYLSEEVTPSHQTIATFINTHLLNNIEEIFNTITAYIIEKQGIDITRVFIDGTKIEAFPNKYTWVWKKACITSRDRKFRKLKELFEELNGDLLYSDQPEYKVKENYSIEELEEYLSGMKTEMERSCIQIVSGKGKHKSKLQRKYDELKKITDKLKEYADKIERCGDGRNSYAKTDTDATFMRMKTDYMGNTALLPAYNWQVVTAGEIILYGVTSQSAADNKCFIPLMEKYHSIFGKYPEIAVADAGYGTLETYDYCEKNHIGKYMKFPSWKRETHDKKFHEDPFRSVNFAIDEDGNPICPNGQKFQKLYERPIRNNKDKRTEEIYQCENCNDCPLREKCHKSSENRKINLNRTLSKYHEEVISNLAAEEGIRLRQVRSAMSEGTFGIIKQDHNFRRLTRVSIKKVNMEFYLIMIGFNLAKYYNLTHREEETNLLS